MDNHIHWTKAQADAHLAKMGHKPMDAPAVAKPKCKMTKTEMQYELLYLDAVPHKFEGITLRMSNGHRYTADWYVVRNNRPELHEVKGGYRLHSYGRSRLAFDQARIEFPEFKFVWATKTKDGWIINEY